MEARNFGALANCELVESNSMSLKLKSVSPTSDITPDTSSMQAVIMNLAEETGKLFCWYLPDWVDGLSMLNWLGTCRQARRGQHGTPWPSRLQATVDFTRRMMAYMKERHIMPSFKYYVDNVLELLHGDTVPLTLPSPSSKCLTIGQAHAREYCEHIACYLDLPARAMECNSFERFVAMVQKLKRDDQDWCKEAEFQPFREKLVEGNARFFMYTDSWPSLLHGPDEYDYCECLYLVFRHDNFYFALCTWPDVDNFL